jgi:hypothetical protein
MKTLWDGSNHEIFLGNIFEKYEIALMIIFVEKWQSH